MPRLERPTGPQKYHYGPEDQIVYSEIPIEAQRWVSAIRWYVGDYQEMDFGCQAAIRLVASLHTYLERGQVTFPRTWKDSWKFAHQHRWWYPHLAWLFRFTEPVMITWEAEAVFPELKPFEGQTTIKYIAHPKRAD